MRQVKKLGYFAEAERAKTYVSRAKADQSVKSFVWVLGMGSRGNEITGRSLSFPSSKAKAFPIA